MANEAHYVQVNDDVANIKKYIFDFFLNTISAFK